MQVAEHPGGRRRYAAYRARVDHVGVAALDVRERFDFRFVIVTAAHQVPVAGGCHGPGVMRVMHQEDFSAGQFDAGILTVECHQAAGHVGDARHHVEIAVVVAVDDMHRQSQGLENAERAGRHDVAAVQYGFGAFQFGGAYRRFEQRPVVVAVGNDADFHFRVLWR